MYFLRIFISEWGVELERFCDRCGSLVSGNGKFCPLCGAKMGLELNISSDLDIDTGSSFLDDLDTSIPEANDDINGKGNVQKAAEVQAPVMNMPNTANTNFSAQQYIPQGYVPQYIPQQPYGQPYQPYGAMPQGNTEKLTMGQWLGTLVLSTCLGAISIVLLILWGFGNDAKEPRKSFARAMLVAVPIIYFVLFFGLGLIACIFD